MAGGHLSEMPIVDRDSALAFIERHGIVMESARTSRPNLVDAVIAARVGSWWKHAEAKHVFWLTRVVRESPDVLVCRLVDGKITYVHRRLWPALVRLESRLPRPALAAIREIHTSTGKHIVKTTPFPRWVPPAVIREAERLTEAEAIGAFRTMNRREGHDRGRPHLI